MCITNVYTDRYPDGKEVEFRQTTYCQYGKPLDRQTCVKHTTLEHPFRKIQFGEPTTEYMLTAHKMDSSRPPRSSSTEAQYRFTGDESDSEGRRRTARLTNTDPSRPKRRHKKKKEPVIAVDSPPVPRTPPQHRKSLSASTPPLEPFGVDNVAQETDAHIFANERELQLGHSEGHSKDMFVGLNQPTNSQWHISGDAPESSYSPGYIQESEGEGRTPAEQQNEAAQEMSSKPPLQADSTSKLGRRARIARTFLKISDRLGKASTDPFDDSSFKRGPALEYPILPGEDQRNSKFPHITRSLSRGSTIDISPFSDLGGDWEPFFSKVDDIIEAEKTGVDNNKSNETPGAPKIGGSISPEQFRRLNELDPSGMFGPKISSHQPQDKNFADTDYGRTIEADLKTRNDDELEKGLEDLEKEGRKLNDKLKAASKEKERLASQSRPELSPEATEPEALTGIPALDNAELSVRSKGYLAFCTECRRRKQKCNGASPCNMCERRYPPVACTYTRDTATANKPVLRKAAIMNRARMSMDTATATKPPRPPAGTTFRHDTQQPVSNGQPSRGGLYVLSLQSDSEDEDDYEDGEENYNKADYSEDGLHEGQFDNPWNEALHQEESPIISQTSPSGSRTASPLLDPAFNSTTEEPSSFVNSDNEDEGMEGTQSGAENSSTLKKFEYPQEGCEKSYSRADNLYRHQLSRPPGQIYYCDLPDCIRAFVRQDLRDRHRDRHTARRLLTPTSEVHLDPAIDLETSSNMQDGMLPRDIQGKTAYYDYAAGKQLSQADAKIFYQRSQLEALKTEGSNENIYTETKSSPQDQSRLQESLSIADDTSITSYIVTSRPASPAADFDHAQTQTTPAFLRDQPRSYTQVIRSLQKRQRAQTFDPGTRSKTTTEGDAIRATFRAIVERVPVVKKNAYKDEPIDYDNEMLSSATLPEPDDFSTSGLKHLSQERGHFVRTLGGRQVWVPEVDGGRMFSSATSNPRSSPSPTASTPDIFPPTSTTPNLSAASDHHLHPKIYTNADRGSVESPALAETLSVEKVAADDLHPTGADDGFVTKRQLNSRSSSVESLQSLVDSIFSVATFSSTSTVAETNNALQRVLAILKSDAALKILYADSVSKTSVDKFNRNLGILLKRFAVDLEKEAKCWNEQRAAQFIRGRARTIAQKVATSVYPSQHESQKLPPRIVEQDGAESSDDSDLEEEPDEFVELEIFITNSTAFQKLRDNIRGFLGLEPSQEEAVLEASSCKLLEELPFAEEGDVDMLIAPAFEEQCPAPYSQGAWRRPSFSQKIRDFLFPESPLADGMSRVRWQCACGETLYDDYRELKPGAAKRMEDYLRRYSYKKCAGDSKLMTESVSNIGRSLKDTISSLGKRIQTIKSGERPALVNTELRYYSDARATRTPAHTSGEVFYLLLCHNSGIGAEVVKLRQPDICDINNDHKLFSFLHEEYIALRKRWWTWISLWTLQSIKFVRFELHENELVDVKKVDEVPPPTKDNEYRHGPPNPPDLNPPLGPTLLMHLFKHPEEAGTKKLCLKKIPRKLRNRLAVIDEEEDAIGWGLQFVEGWSKKRLMYTTALTFGLSSFVVMVLVSVLGHDVQNAGAIASFMLSFVTIGIATAQAALHMS